MDIISTRNSTPRQLIAAPAAARDHAVAVARLVKFNLKDSADRYLLCYLATVIELAGACLALAESRQFVGIPILMRSVLEAHADFRCLNKDPDHVEHIEASQDHHWARVIDEAMRNGNAYLAKLGNELTIIAERDAIKTRQEDRKRRGIRCLKVNESFEKADMLDLYYSVYRFLCSEAHNNADALNARHIAGDASSGFTLNIYGDSQNYLV